jgi:adenylate cyclase
MLAELTPCGGGQAIPLYLRKVVVGRSNDCDVTIPALSVSSRHCELNFDGLQWQLSDVGSRNGTSVNGERCRTAVLHPGDEISFARERFIIRYDLAEATTTGSPPPENVHPNTEDSAGSEPEDSTTDSTTRSAQFGRLVPCGGGDPIPLLKPVLLIGRKSHCDIQLRFNTVSGEHCRMEHKDGYWFIEELKSTNGIKVDGVRCRSHWLHPLSVLSIANHRYQIWYEPTGDEPPPEPDPDPFSVDLLEKAGLSQQIDSQATAKWKMPDDEQPQTRRRTLDEDD